jgi:Asp-tRNA(Asn)/Glu-tRNA(Gln) amidotransferase A subunit family amidase
MPKSVDLAHPELLSASAARAAIASGQLTSERLVRACLERIDAREGEVKAWVNLDRNAALARAKALDRSSDTGPLHGIPIAFKDIIDTATLPTTYGSPIYAEHRPVADAACVSLTRRAGAVMMGKTVTTEFAVRHPNKTRNPHNLAHTPGGSSSGSAAAVGDHMVPLAFGTQTAGSIIRPAAYCGTVGYKPTIGQFSYVGVKLLSRSLDTLGAMARSVDDLVLLRSALMATPAHLPERTRAPRIGFYRTPWWDRVEPSSQALLNDVAAQLGKAGADVVEVDIGPALAPLSEANVAIMAYEGCRSLAFELEFQAEKISQVLRDIMLPAQQMLYGEYAQALNVAASAREAVQATLLDFDVLLVPSAPGEAPLGLTNTGNPLFNKAWTTVGNPCITLPAGRGPAGLPLGIQLVGNLYADEALLASARWVETHLQ